MRPPYITHRYSIFFVYYSLFTDAAIIPYGTVSPEIQVVYTGSFYPYITCYSATPVKWEKDGRNIASVLENILEFPHIEQKDSGQYTCHGTLENGNETFEAHSTILVGGKYFMMLFSLKLISM